MRTCQAASTYLRIADPDWEDLLDGVVSMRRGGRWNAPGSFPAVYLCADADTARANARLLLERTIDGMPFALDDLEPDALPVLVGVKLPSGDIVDALTDEGLEQAGLPSTYPRRTSGDPLPWSACQRTGGRAHQAGSGRIAYRSAALAAGRGELAWFTDVAGALTSHGPARPFNDWFWATSGDLE